MGRGPNDNRPVDYDGTRQGVDPELLKLRDELRHERDLLATERAELQRRVASLEANSQSEQQLGSRVQAMEAAIQRGNTLPPQGGSGNVIVVRRGEFIGYDTRRTRNNLQGGWVKASQDDSVSVSVPMIAVANQDFQYDDQYGAPYHSVSFTTYKRFFQDPNRNQVVGNGLPAQIIATPGLPQLTMV